MTILRAIVVDDEKLARRGLAMRLQPIPQVEVVAECANGLEALSDIARLAPDLVFLDIRKKVMGRGQCGLDQRVAMLCAQQITQFIRRLAPHRIALPPAAARGTPAHMSGVDQGHVCPGFRQPKGRTTACQATANDQHVNGDIALQPGRIGCRAGCSGPVNFVFDVYVWHPATLCSILRNDFRVGKG